MHKIRCFTSDAVSTEKFHCIILQNIKRYHKKDFLDLLSLT